MPNKILVVRLSSLGDVVLTAPVYKNLKAHWPDCRISVLVKPQFAPALEGNPYISEIIPFTGLSSALRRIRAEGFTHLLDLHDNLRSFFLREFSGIPAKAVYRKNAVARRLFVAFGWTSPSLQQHNVDRYLQALAPWGVPVQDGSLTLGDRREAPHALANGAPKNVLLIQSAFLGDTLLTLPLARDLKSLYPECRLSVLTLEKTAEVFRGSPWVDEILLDHKRGAHSGPLGLWRLSRDLKERRFDLAVIPHRSFRSALLGLLCGIPERIGFASSAARFLLTKAVPFAWPMHDLERNLSLLLPLHPGLKVRPDESRYMPAGPVSPILLQRLQDAGIAESQTLVGVHPGSAWPTKRWLPERFSELCRGLLAEGVKVVLIGAAQDAELCSRIAAESGALDWSAKTTLAELKALMPRLSLFITNDSGPMHVATASAVPTLAIFGPTTRELGFFPYGREHRVLEADLSCRPCGLHGGRSCPEGHFLCMKLITVDQVRRAAAQMLSAHANTAR